MAARARMPGRAVRARSAEPAGRVGLAHELDVLFGKVERRLGQHAQLGHRVDQHAHLARELAGERPRGRACRRRRGGIDQVGHAFRLRKVELAVQNARRVNSPGAARRAPSSRQRARTSFSAAGLPCPCNSSTSSPVYDAGAGKQQRDALVERLAARAAEDRERRGPRVERPGDEGGDDLPHVGARHAHDADAASSSRRGDCRDGLGGGLRACAHRGSLPCAPNPEVGKVGSDSTFQILGLGSVVQDGQESRV